VSEEMILPENLVWGIKYVEVVPVEVHILIEDLAQKLDMYVPTVINDGTFLASAYPSSKSIGINVQSWSEWTVTEQMGVLAHELAHLKCGHTTSTLDIEVRHQNEFEADELAARCGEEIRMGLISILEKCRMKYGEGSRLHPTATERINRLRALTIDSH
jgi:Zn-dependent protease with chaperone function